jgi:RNA-directed DNA polymerase
MEVSKDNVKDSQLQLEGLYRENSPEGKYIDTASQLSGKKRYTGTNTNYNIDTSKIFDRIVSYENMHRAFSKVASNKGSGGVDGMKASELLPYFEKHYRELKDELLEKRYRPQPVRRVEIPKNNGKKRQLGIPTVIDRGVQMSIANVLSEIYEPLFSETSYGFRPNRSAHNALKKCLEYAREGRVWVVDLDLERFFDTVQQSRLLQMVSTTVTDGRVISLLYRFVKAGVMVNGIKRPTDEGVPQGGPLSPLLSNIMLNDCDKELERRGHAFVRYADDLMVFCKTQRAAVRVMESITKFLEGKLKLKVNRKKSVVCHITKDVKFLGHGFYNQKRTIQLTIHRKSYEKMKLKLKEVLNKSNGWSYDFRKTRLSYLVRGWVNYFRYAHACRFPEIIREKNSILPNYIIRLK